MRGSVRRLTRLESQFAAGLAILIWCACAPPRLVPLNYSGNWSGTTSQGRVIAFTVTRDLRITAMTIEYSFGGCSDSLTIPADAPLWDTSGATPHAQVTYTLPGGTGPSRTISSFWFRSITKANGSLQFIDAPICGSTNATWTATKQ